MNTEIDACAASEDLPTMFAAVTSAPVDSANAGMEKRQRPPRRAPI
jgi:hypothetical protein